MTGRELAACIVGWFVLFSAPSLSLLSLVYAVRAAR